MLDALRGILGPEQITLDPHERLLHSYGKSFPDLFRVRSGLVTRAPDAVLFPDSHEQVQALVLLAHQHNFCLIPFGGGTNIVGGINPEQDNPRPGVDAQPAQHEPPGRARPAHRGRRPSRRARSARSSRPISRQQGIRWGIFPTRSNIPPWEAGWRPARRACSRMRTAGSRTWWFRSRWPRPPGTIVTKAVPASSAGPDLNRIMIGSEGILGMITEATMRVHRAPASKDYRGFLFKTFADGVRAIEECLDRGFAPSMVRLQDSGETELAFNMKAPATALEGWIQRRVKGWLKSRGYVEPCILVIGFEGDAQPVEATRRGALEDCEDGTVVSHWERVSARRGRRTSSTSRICATTSWTMAAWLMWRRRRLPLVQRVAAV